MTDDQLKRMVDSTLSMLFETVAECNKAISEHSGTLVDKQERPLYHYGIGMVPSRKEVKDVGNT